MPFFYSQYLVKDEKKGKKLNTTRPNTIATTTTTTTTAKTPPPAITTTPKQQRAVVGRLVWHSNIGASGKRNNNNNNKATNKPLQLFHHGNYHHNRRRKKVVHFATVEVRHFRFDWKLADQVFYTRAELASMNQARFDDAATLRAQRREQQQHPEDKGGGVGIGGGGGASAAAAVGEQRHTVDDVAISKKSKEKDIATLLNTALDDPDLDETVSIRGIEHFVYPDLQQEMIRRKKELQREVLEFSKSSRPDPQGWRLADHSRFFSLWARTVAVEKATKYYINNAAVDPEVGTISRDELERIQRSGDELESTASSRMRRGSSILSLIMSQSYEGEERPHSSSLNSVNGGGSAEVLLGSRFDLRKSSSDSLESAPTIEEEEEKEGGGTSVFHQMAQSKITWETENHDRQDTQPAGSETGED